MSHLDTDIAEKKHVDQVLIDREMALESFESAIRALESARTRIQQYAPHALYNTDKDTRGIVSAICAGSDSQRLINSFTKAIDKGIWGYLGAATGLEQYMDHTALKEWRETIEKDTPECNIDTLSATFNHLNNNKLQIFNRGLVKAFKSLEGHYKTNDSFKISHRIIVTNATTHRSYGSEYINDVDRVLHVLDKKKPPDYRSSIRLKLINSAPPTVIDTEYMAIKLYKNHNAHVTFKRQDIIDKANMIIAAFYGESLQSDSKSTGVPV